MGLGIRDHIETVEANFLSWYAGLTRGRYAVSSHKSPLSAPLIISLTSFPPRFGKLEKTLDCLLAQTIRADKIVLWVSSEEIDQVPPSVEKYTRLGVEILPCTDYRSYNKLVHSVAAWPESFIVTADDDVYYGPRWLEKLVRAYEPGSRDVPCHRAHSIATDETGRPRPYDTWTWDVSSSDAPQNLFFTGVGGVLYPPDCFFGDMLRSEKFLASCPTNDDIWFNWMVWLNGGVAKKVGGPCRLIRWPGTQGIALFDTNVGQGQNDVMIGRMLDTYGYPMVS